LKIYARGKISQEKIFLAILANTKDNKVPFRHTQENIFQTHSRKYFLDTQKKIFFGHTLENTF